MKKVLHTLEIMLLAATMGAPALAQMHKVTDPETVVRAVGVYEWTGELAKPSASRFVPVTLYINGELQDAGIYLPRPVPFALLSGNVYELEDAGLSKGLLELESALNTTTPDGAPAPAFTEGWTGYGSYKPPAPEKKPAALKPSKTLPVISTSGGDSKPHFGNKSADSQDSSTANKSDKPDTTQSQSQPTADSDRPTMKRRSDTSSTADAKPDATTTGSTDDDDKAERPSLRRRSPEDVKNDKKKKKEKEQASVSTAGSLNDDPDRPTLKHGSKANASDDMPKLLGVPAGMKQIVAVSDAKTRDPHPFAREWNDDAERGTILAKMQTFARAKLAEYGTVPGMTPPAAITGNTTVGGTTAAPASSNTKPTSAGDAKASTGDDVPPPPKLKRGIPTDATTNGLPPAPATPSPAPTATAPAAKTTAPRTAAPRRVAAKPGPVVLADEDLKGYLLSYGGAPTFVYTAHTVETGSVMRYVTVIAQDDGMGNLKVALASATDAAHLDRTPWMRFVGVVDAEASNRASLVFELRGASSRQFALYRVIAAKPEQIFVTNNSGG